MDNDLRKIYHRQKKEPFWQQGKIDIPFLILTIALIVIGLIMLYSASYPSGYYYYKGDSFHFVRSQLVFAIIGVIGMLFVSKINYRILKRFALPIFAVSYLLLVVTLFMPSAKGAKRWIEIGGFSFQPSEIVKFAVILLFATYISMYARKMEDFRYGVIPFVVIFAMVAIVLLLQPHLSGLIIVFALTMVMMFIGGTKIRWFLIAGGIAVIGIIAIALSGKLSHTGGRISAWLDPFGADSDLTWQTRQSLYAIGSGGLLGTGIGQSRQKHLYLPEPQNDFIFAIVCEELGFIGAMLIIILFAIFIVRGIILSMRNKDGDLFGRLLGVGLVFQIAVQVILNIAVVTNTVPNTGISLPFFSSGGTSLVMLLLQMGVVLSIGRRSMISKS